MIEYIDGDLYENVYVVGDLHGCYDKLKAKLKEVKFNYTKDLLIAVGDLVDRGNKNEECALLIGQPWFKCVRGNHEQLCINGYYDHSLRVSHSKKGNGGSWLYQLPDQLQEYIANLFDTLPVVIELKLKGRVYGFVHADVCIDQWDDFKSAVKSDIMIGDRSACERTMRDRVNFKKQYHHISGVDRVYLGHNVATKGIKIVGNMYFIDTGAVFGLPLTLLKVGDKHVK